jgi:hypothetical protein
MGMPIRLKLLVIFLLISLMPVFIVGTFYDLKSQKAVKDKVSDLSMELV